MQNELENCQYSCYDESDKQTAEVGTSKATTVAVLRADCSKQYAQPTDYGNSVQNSAPEIAPTGDRSVGLRQMLFDLLQLLSLGDLLNLNLVLFHNFFTLSSDYVRIITLIDYHFFYRLSRGILLFLEKYFIFSNSVQLLFTKNSN